MGEGGPARPVISRRPAARLALARVESLLPRTVVETAEQVMRSSDSLVGLLRKVQAFNTSRFGG